MSFFSAIRVALAALFVNKGRSVLTSLGIVIGISAVIAMVSAASGVRLLLDERLEKVGKNLILIRAGARNQQGIVTDISPLTSADTAAIRKKAGHLLVGVADSQMTQRIAATKDGYHLTALVGSTPDLRKVRNWKMKYGDFYTDEDVKRMAQVCLIGQTVQRKLFPDKVDPVGQKLRVDRLELRIVGVLEEKGRSPTGADQDDQIFLPITTLQRKLMGMEQIAVIVATAKNDQVLDQAKREIINVLRDQHRIRPGSSDDFDVSTVQEMAQLGVIVTTAMQLLTAVITSISLVVGGIGIMNIMLVSVTERTREIGIRMAVGATSADVLMQFLTEAVVLALVGGIIGIILGMIGAVALAHFANWPIDIDPQMVVLAFLVAAGVGVFFGYYPALKASRLDPIDALRYE